MLKYAALLLSLSLSMPLLAVAQGENPAKDPLTPCDYKAADTPGQEFRIDPTQDRLHSEPKLVEQIKRELGLGLEAVKSTWPGQRGYEADYFRAMPKAAGEHYEQYQLFATMLAYRCIESTGEIRKPILASGDYAVKAFQFRLSANRPTNFFAEKILMTIDGAPHTVLETFDYQEDWGGLAIYGADGPGRRVMYVARTGEEPFIALTERQYLEELVQLYHEQYGTPGHPGKAPTYQYIASDVAAELADLQLYLRETPAAELARPARANGFIGRWGMRRSGRELTREPLPLKRKGQREFFILNHGYFRKSEPAHVPQLYVLEIWQPSVGKGSRILMQRFRDNPPQERLRALLDH